VGLQIMDTHGSALAQTSCFRHFFSSFIPL